MNLKKADSKMGLLFRIYKVFIIFETIAYG